MKIGKIAALIITILIIPSLTQAYPLNGNHRTDIARLEGYFFSLYTDSGKKNFAPGSLLSMSEVELSLKGKTFDLPPIDQELSRDIAAVLGKDASRFSVSLVDISDPNRPLYASLNEKATFIPGSVGKIMVALTLMQTLRDLYPLDQNARVKVLRDSYITADEVILNDDHDVPFWDRDETKLEFRPIRIGDRANVWTFLDWMLSASSNAAGSMIMREIVILKHFGHAYPPDDAARQAFLKNTPKAKLAAMMSEASRLAIVRSGLNPALLYQGSLFTKAGREAIPSRGSTANTRELARFLLRMEQGRLVDEFSSRELKLLLYSTQQRIRYASSPALDFDAVYYKSGSLYRCRGEAGFSCGKYRGNLLNLMNSVAEIESPYTNPKYRYIVAVNSNVLYRDSAELHALLAAKIKDAIEKRHAAQ